MDNKIIRTEEQFKKLMAERQENAAKMRVNEDSVVDAKHAEVASQAIKVINSIRMEPFIKRVMTLRIIGPMITGHERTHLSIALELGATVDDVIQAEQAGIEVVNEILQKVSLPDFIEKFNRDRKAEETIKAEIDKQTNG